MTEHEPDRNLGADPKLKYPEWVRLWRSIHIGWLAAFLVLSAVSVTMVVTVVSMFVEKRPDAVMGFSLLAVVVFGMLGGAVVLSGLGSARLSRFVRPVYVAGVGRGLSVPGRGDLLILSMILGFGVMAGVAQFMWRDDDPIRLRASAYIWGLIGAPALLLYFVVSLAIVNRNRISLHPDGIVHQIYRRRAWKVASDITVVPWDDIVDLLPHGHPNPALSHPHWYPTIRVLYREASSESDQALVLMACEKKVEPNSLFALLQWCRDNPWAREHLARDDARELLRPPGLLERIEADRAATASHRRDAVQ